MLLALKNIAYFWKTHLLVALSLALACAVIVASLIVGDSLEKTLEDKAINRLGKVDSYVEKLGGYADCNIVQGDVSAILSLDAIATANGLSRATKLYVVDDKFWELSLSSKAQNLGDGLAINETMAVALNLQKDSTIALRFPLKNASSEIALSDSSPEILSSSFKISKILSPEDFADFYLYDWQNSPPNIFISQEFFNKTFALDKSANFFLSKDENIKFIPNFEKLGLSLKSLGSSYIVKSKDIFIADEIIEQIPNAEKTLAWFVSKISLPNSEDYNAFIVGAGSDLASKEVEINDVYAKEHALKIGDSLTLTYYVFDEKLNLKLSDISLKVAKISPINSNFFTKDIVPEYDGLTDVDDCSDWKSSIPIDLKKITDSHKDYWNNYGACPKFRVSYELSLALFSGDMGSATALVLGSDPHDLDFSKVDLSKLGFIINHPKENALSNAQNGVDFRGLFIGLSFFIIFNAMLLIALVFRMNISARFKEIRLFKYLGYRNKRIENLYLKEFFFSIILGGLLGAVLGIFFAKILIFMLNGIWGDISDGAKIFFSLKITSVVLAFAMSACFAFAILKFFAKKLFRQRKLKSARGYKVSVLLINAILFVLSLGLGVFAELGIGYKALLSLLAFVSGAFLSISIFKGLVGLSKNFGAVSFIKIGIVGSLSKSVYVILSLGVYLLCVVGLNKIDTSANISEYEYVVKTFVGTKIPENDKFDILALRVKSGANANCLNLNKVAQSQVLGADIDALKSAGVISLKSKYEGELADDVVAMYVDESSMIWSLKASMGDEFEYDTKRGKVKLKIVGALNPSIFQGSFIIEEEDFKSLWGASDAYNIFLAKPKNGAREVDLAKIFSAYLPDVNKAESILKNFDSLQNAYLKIFYQLGILGFALGVIGTLISIRNSLLVQRDNLLFMNKLGLRASFISKIIATQYLVLNLSASILGVLASLPLIRIEDNYLKAFLILLIVLLLNLLLYPIVRALVSLNKAK